MAKSWLPLLLLVGCVSSGVETFDETPNPSGNGGMHSDGWGDSGSNDDSGWNDSSGNGDSGGGWNGGGDTGGNTGGDNSGGWNGGDTGGNTGGDNGGNTGGGDPPPPPVLDLPIATMMEPSQNPPGGLTPEQVPQFIVLGFDDNRYVDGMKWVLDMLGQYRNPSGNGNERTHDGQPLIASFYFTTNALDDAENADNALLDQWKRAKSLGHEVANHTHTHRAYENERPWNWEEELSTANRILESVLDLPPGSVIGVRAPFLNFDDVLFAQIKAQGMLYDCSLEHIPVDNNDKAYPWNHYRHIWPYTLHKGTDGYSGQASVGMHAGVWEVPVYTMPLGPTRHESAHKRMSGFDSTAYGTLKISASDFYNSMKWSLDLRLEPGDNRAPLTIGLHSDTYSAKHTGYIPSLEERRKALVDFIEYALTKPDVRFVSAKQLLQWMSDPKPL